MQNIIQIMANPTRESVLQSVKEYDEIGLDEFSKLYGPFGNY